MADGISDGQLQSVGSVSGTLECVSSHNNNFFVMYPPVSGEAIECHCEGALLRKILLAVGRHVTVYGKLQYSNNTMFPVRVLVDSFEVMPETDTLPDLRNLKGAISLDMPSQDVVRTMRNEWP